MPHLHRRKFDHQIAAQRYRDGASLEDLAAEYGVQRGNLKKALKRMDVEFRDPGRPVKLWPPERVARVRALAALGWSAAEIGADALVDATRSAVAGACDRNSIALLMQAGGNAAAAIALSRFHAVRRSADRGGGLLLKMRAKQVDEQFGNRRPLPKDVPSSVEIIGPVAGEEIPDMRECKWIEGEVGKGGRYCGQPVHELLSYCLYHCSRVYNAAPPRARRSVTPFWQASR